MANLPGSLQRGERAHRLGEGNIWIGRVELVQINTLDAQARQASFKRTPQVFRPQSLAPGEVYALTAFLLHQNGVIPADAVLDATSLPKVAMPNRNGFTVPDGRPDVRGARCMQDCK